MMRPLFRSAWLRLIALCFHSGVSEPGIVAQDIKQYLFRSDITKIVAIQFQWQCKPRRQSTMIRRQSTMIKRILLFVSLLGRVTLLYYVHVCHLLSIIRGNFHILENSWDLQCLVWFGKQLGTLSTRKTSGNLDMKSSWRGHSDSCVRIISIYMIPTGVPEICGNASVLCANLKGCDESEIIGAGAAVSWICWLIFVHTLYSALMDSSACNACSKNQS